MDINFLYTEPLISVSNNGHSTRFFSISRGIRQGCPISSLLFILVAETLAEKIRINADIIGINVETEEFKLTQLADDTTLFLQNEKSLQCVLKELDHFGLCAGLMLNKEKTEVIKLGHNAQTSSNKICGITITNKPLKTLGIWISKNHNECLTLNYNEKLKKLENVLNIWRTRKLTLKGKITVLQSLALAQIYFTASILYVPPQVIADVTKLTYNFLWPNKEHVKRTTIIQDLEFGGLKMPDFFNKVKAMKIMWVKRLTENKKLALLSKNLMKLKIPLAEFIKFKNDSSFLNDSSPKFYKQVFDCWYEIYSNEPNNAEEIRAEILFNNKFIQIGFQPIFYTECYNKQLIYINNILDDLGNFINLTDLNEKFSTHLNIMSYNSIKHAIPLKWKKTLKNSKTVIIDDTVKVKLNNKSSLLTAITNRSVYWHLINKIGKTATACLKWEDTYNTKFDWNEIFLIPYKITQESFLQNLQYQILHRFYPCNKVLHIWYKDHSNLCSACNEEDTLEHYFYLCDQTFSFWNQLNRWWHSLTAVKIQLNNHYVIFGIINENDDPLLNAFNFCILYGKFYISDCKRNHRTCCFFVFLREFKNRLETEREICYNNAKSAYFLKTWEDIYDSL